MKFQNPERLKNVRKVVKNLTTFGVLTLGLAVIFYSPKFSSAVTIVTKCADYVGTAQPGNNCLFYGKPLCQTVPSASYTIASTEIIASNPRHRDNCADLSDLPLCNQIDSGHTATSIKTCVRDCGEKDGSNNFIFTDPDPLAIPANVRGVDYAVHNRDCVRFCDTALSVEGITPDDGVNCVGRKCHQLASGVTPISSGASANCNLVQCNFLTSDELNESKFSDDTKQYCDGSSVKCYNFLLEQLPYTRYRVNNTMCQIHDCKPQSNSPSCSTDDTLNITGQDTPGCTGDNCYSSAYNKFINANLGYSGGGICNPVTCKAVINRAYRCTTNGTTISGDDTLDIVRNNLCDATGGGATCTNNFCYKVIDCNINANSTQPECVNSTTTDDGTIGSTDDSMNSWFYRPKPAGKAVNGSGILLNIDNGLCYSGGDQLYANGFGNHPVWHFSTIFGDFDIDFGFHHDYLGMDSRSPGLCGKGSLGSRGNGYIYLCGPNGSLYSDVDRSQTAFHKGYVRTDFREGDATHKLVVCLRFNNAMVPGKTCGTRECGISCAFNCDGGGSQVCGYDVCKELTVTDMNMRECEMNDDFFNNENNGKGCAETIDTYLRLRAVKYNDRICTFLDVKGQLAYSSFDPFFNGTETLADGTCISGTKDGSGNCTGKNTKDSKGTADKWRTKMQIPYIQDNRPSGQPKGYLDKSGQLFPEQECIKTSLRIPPPRLYNLGTSANSQKLFTPPLYIINTNLRRGGAVSNPPGNELFGPTDFHFPEIVVKFGTTTKELSLGLGKTGYETTGADPLASGTISTTINNLTYSMDIYIRKEFNVDSLTPMVCLYRKVRDENGIELDPVRVGCAKRNLPEIDNQALRAMDPTLTPEKLIISADAANTYDSSKIVFSYLGALDSSSSYNTCNNSNCTTDVRLLNADPLTPTCDSSLEKYQICAQREECSKINNECMKNEVDMQTARIAGQPIDSYLSVRNNCNSILIPLCNGKKGINDPAATITNTNPSNAAGDPYAYGWFNEICISSGFENKLKDVIAYRKDGIRGKCVISGASPYLTDGNPATNCDAGGKAPNCLCVERVADVVEPNEAGSPPETYRKQTPHEAGLCVDMPLPQTCSAIDYNPGASGVDPDYIVFSLNNNSYGTTAGTVHTTHQARTNGTASGHGEFPLAILGMNDVEGDCKGFWRAARNGSGVIMQPKLNCLNNSGTAVWENPARNACVRYSCPLISTTGPDANGLYQGGYGAIESGESKGSSHGYATWPSYTKTNDFLESVTATSCITGFKRSGATTLMSGGETDTTHASLYGLITGYSGGTLPSRTCNQLGSWNLPSSNCVRIACPAVNPPASPSPSDTAAWELWDNAGGATFPSVNASRSSLRIQAESVSTGTCNNSLGFFQAPGGIAPTRKCDYLGNWSAVINPCVTQCDAVTGTDANSDVNGYSYWDQAVNVPLRGEAPGVLTTASGNNGCVSGYYPYPYPALKDSHGNTLTISTSGPYRTDSGANSSLTTIPKNLANDTRATGYPKRYCTSVITAGGATNVWTATDSRCVNYCPGSDTDSRIGAGSTEHPLSSGATLTINWPQANFGQWSYATGQSGSVSVSLDTPNLSQQDATLYSSSTRSNGYYAMARYCNPTTHKWDDPIAQCATKNAQIASSNANYNTPPNLVADDAATTTVPEAKIATGACIPSANFYKANYNTAAISRYRCVARDSNKNIDQYYFQQIDGSACVHYCQISNNQVFGNAHYTGDASVNSGLIDIGTNMTLRCNSNYGNKITPGASNTGVVDDCGRAAGSISVSDRSLLPAATLCQSDGTWGSVTNNCDACRDCDNSSSVYGTISCTPSKNCVVETFCVSGLTPNCRTISIDRSSVANGGTTGNSGYYEDYCFPEGNSGICGAFNLKCYDNAYYSKSDCHQDAGCSPPGF